ncbi:helix-turn-helix domain-containing protein [Microbacterium sp. MEC084]|uniref:IclR family transcriptional regulator n=1 Tax=Microbacterium sp. MEC084 TaxID=1963027 RepID=UPI00142F9C4D|nr:IclR family transcriptional regulator [Microbacterium sp. MEC084]MCD1269813.1 helix-turn-helix domain-containing protein [Microbacterium sp. MEC084]
MARSSEGTSALTRVLAVLDAFTADAPFLTLTQIHRRSRIPLSSVHRIVAELVAHGLLEPVAGRTYRLGNRLWEIGSKTPGALGLREIAEPYLRRLHDEVGQHVQLAVRIDTDVLIIERISAPDAVINGSIVGGRIPIQLSSSGLVFLAFGEPGLLDAVLEGGIRPMTSAGPQTAEQLRAAVDATRAHGYADAEGWIHPASRGLAVPVRGSEDVVVGALGAVVPNDGASPRRLAALLQETAHRISDALLRAYLPAGHPRALPGGSLRALVSSSAQSMQYLERRARAR